MGNIKDMFTALKNLIVEIINLFKQPNQIEPSNKNLDQKVQFFNTVTFLEKAPKNSEIKERTLVCVTHNNKYYWTLFLCPCGCADVINLPMQPPHHPKWNIDLSRNQPSLYPSIWRNKGCMSHFWIKNGAIVWCDDTGIAPWLARPDIYKKPSV